MVFNGPCYLRGMGNVTRMNNSLQSPQKGENCLGKSLHTIGISRGRLQFSVIRDPRNYNQDCVVVLSCSGDASLDTAKIIRYLAPSAQRLETQKQHMR